LFISLIFIDIIAFIVLVKVFLFVCLRSDLLSVAVVVKELEEINIFTYKDNCRKSGIYQIRNTCNGKIYVGSASDFASRKSKHFFDLRNDKHINKHLQRAFKKYSEENFVFEIIECIEKVEDIKEFRKLMLEREQYWIDNLNVCDSNYGYNINPTAGSCLGVKRSEESKKKMSESQKGIQAGDKNPMYGKTHTEEARKNISNAQKLRQHIITPETKKKMSLAQQGEKHSGKTLTDNQVIEIKKLLCTSIKQAEIARIFNIDPRVVSAIKSGKTWSHIHIDGIEEFKMGKKAKLSENDVIEIKKLLATTKLLYREIGEIFNVSSVAIGSIKRGLTWKHIKLEDYLDEDGNLKDVI
jgi:group I intron endonuclease